jgi:hypothetical protein
MISNQEKNGYVLYVGEKSNGQMIGHTSERLNVKSAATLRLILLHVEKCVVWR